MSTFENRPGFYSQPGLDDRPGTRNFRFTLMRSREVGGGRLPNQAAWRGKRLARPVKDIKGNPTSGSTSASTR